MTDHVPPSRVSRPGAIAPVHSGWRPIPWRGAVGGIVAALTIIGIVAPFDKESVPWLVVFFGPLLSLIWAGAAAYALFLAGTRQTFAITTLGALSTVLWFVNLLGISGSDSYDGSAGENLALIAAGACGVALSEWVLSRPSVLKWGLAVPLFLLSLVALGVASDHAAEQRIEPTIVKAR